MTAVGALDRTVFWTPVEGPGLEHLRLRSSGDGFEADGTVLGIDGTTPFRLHYRIATDSAWRTRRVVLRLFTPAGEQIRRLFGDGQGGWLDEHGIARPDLRDCFDVDLSATPFTNTLTINRLRLHPGQRADIDVVYVKTLELTVARSSQSYACRHLTGEGAAGLYEAYFPASDFRVELPVDADGLVSDYPELFRRVYPR